ncbi:toluene tolerance protein [Vibrio sp. 10N.286.49.B3]|uniref:MlaC/ttg2D family ABC transporter substrate-binding protein n=1 Tax=Vibrio sp. 10N.286.49.B3 TaxID=1880855 RepID=UPI000C83CC34|nr:phospholipid-binding protein MlaC [Vibrio sp. 10N.286.49.B3]PMH42596.1 toluene tolerance protein [Vibrio sp. 10N.286.49.B3]
MVRQTAIRFYSLLVSFLLSTSVLAQSAVDATDPNKMMKQVAELAFDRLKSEQESIKSDPERLKLIVEEELMPYVNYRYAALKLLGSNVKGAKREDVGVFFTAFRNYLVTSYAQVLTQYTNQKIEFPATRNVSDEQTITGVKVAIIDAPRANINLEFKLRKDKKSGEWKAFDMSAEGISLLSSKQSEWNTKIRQEGVLSVAKELQQLSEQPIVYKSIQ